jgi:hypothetical protein
VRRKVVVSTAIAVTERVVSSPRGPAAHRRRYRHGRADRACLGVGMTGTRARSFRRAAADPGRKSVAVDSPGSIRCGYVLISRLPGVLLDTVRDELRPQSGTGWPAGRNRRGPVPAAAIGDQELVSGGLASFRDRQRRVSVNSGPWVCLRSRRIRFYGSSMGCGPGRRCC